MDRLGRFFPLGNAPAIDGQMKNLQPCTAYDAADFEIPAVLVDAVQPATLMEALDPGLDSYRDAIAIRDHRLCGAVSGVDVQEKV
jgi:hypothetical protein